MIIPDVLLVLAAGLVTGILIGAVGVGGVLIAPLLVLLAGFEVHEAVAVASFSSSSLALLVQCHMQGVETSTGMPLCGARAQGLGQPG